MMRRFLVTAALVASAGLYVLAQGRPATFILTDGERKTGSVGFYGDQQQNLIGGYFGLDTSNGRERYKVEQVAVIDFAGGQPPAAEVSQLPAENGVNVLVLKDGVSQRGRLVNLTAGNVQWQNEAGQAQQYSIDDVSRIYINPASARMALNAPSSTASAVGTSGQAVPGSVQVNANQAWTDTGVTVKKGDRVSFQTTGQISIAQGQTADAGGKPEMKSGSYPVPAAGVGALIARVNNGAPFPIGTNSSPITMPADGRLMLGINDDYLGDNSGAFSVVVRKQ